MLINYWRGIIGDIGIYERHREAISRLYRGEWHGLHVERLRVNNTYVVYSMRLGSKGRLLFTSIDNRLCLLEVLENHEYHRSRFLNTRGAVEAFCRRVSEDSAGCSSAGIVVDEMDETSLSDIFVRDEQESITWRAVEAHGKHLIQLSDEQDSAVSARLPSVVLGPAGSGKTSVLLSSMLRYVREQATSEEAFPVVYVCQSPGLAEKMSSLWQGMVDDEQLRSRVVFKTVEALYQEHYPSQRLANDEQRFLQWYQETLSVKERLGMPAPALYEEFRVCCGYEQAAYVQLGVKESRVSIEQRASCYALYQRYLSYLQSHNEYSSVLGCVESTREAAPRYRMAFWDEAQVLSLAQLRWLSSIVPAGQFMACFGEHQSLHDGVSRYEYLKKLCHRLHTRLEEHALSGTFRCSSAVTLVLNQLLAIKFAALGGSQDKHESPLVESSASIIGSAVLLSQQSADLAAYVNRETVDFAVVTNQAQIEEARRRFKTALVFTPEEIQGLEFKVVLVYRPLDNEAARKINARLGDELPMVGHAHRPKVTDASTSELERFMNRLVTMSSRAVQDVVVVQNSAHATKKIYACLKKVMSESAREAMSDANAVSSEAQWLEQAAKLVAHGLLAQARTIVTKILKKSEREFDTWLKSCTPETSVVAVQSVPETAAVISAPTPNKKPLRVQAALSQEPGSSAVSVDTKPSRQRRAKNTGQANSSRQLSVEEQEAQSLLENYTVERLQALISKKTEYFLTNTKLSLEGKKNKPLLHYLSCNIPRARVLLEYLVTRSNESQANCLYLLQELHRVLNSYLSSTTNPEERLYLSDIRTIIAWASRFSPGNPLMVNMVITRNVNILKVFYRLKIDLEQFNFIGKSLAIFAIDQQAFDILDQLIDWKTGGLDRESTSGGLTVACLASAMGRSDILRKLAAIGIDPNRMVDPDNRPVYPMLIAIHKGHLEVFQTLLELGARVRHLDLMAVIVTGKLEMIECAYRASVDFSVYNPEARCSPLFSIIISGNIPVLKQLLSLGQSFDKQCLVDMSHIHEWVQSQEPACRQRVATFIEAAIAENASDNAIPISPFELAKLIDDSAVLACFPESAQHSRYTFFQPSPEQQQTDDVAMAVAAASSAGMMGVFEVVHKVASRLGLTTRRPGDNPH